MATVYRIVDNAGELSRRVKCGTPRLAADLVSARRMLNNAGRRRYKIQQLVIQPTRDQYGDGYAMVWEDVAS